MILAKRAVSLVDLPEKPEGPLDLTPRSRNACLSEGIDISELIYRPLEEFADEQLSPRIVKLRYDYFEAKRKDLLGLAHNSRDRILRDNKPNLTRSSTSVHTLNSASTTSPSEWGMLTMEREKLARFQRGEKKWLENCLRHELDLLKQLEADDERLTEESQDNSKKMVEESRRIKEMNDRRRAIDEQKQRIAEAQQELDREKAKKAFAEHQEELQKLEEKEAERKRQAHLKSLRDAEMRTQKEMQKKRQQDQLWAEKQQALSEMQQHDMERISILEKCKNSIMEKLHERRSVKELRVSKSIEKNSENDKKRKQALLNRLLADRDRDQRLAIKAQQQQEESAKRSLQLIIKRKIIQDESCRKQELRKLEILSHQAEMDKRLAEHEHKRERYLAFKRELETLRERNKQLNVDRQRKKEQYLRDVYATRVVEKDTKVETIFAKRQEMWEVRRKTALESQKSRDHVKRTIMEMRIKSKVNAKQLEQYVENVVAGLDQTWNNEPVTPEQPLEGAPQLEMIEYEPEGMQEEANLDSQEFIEMENHPTYVDAVLHAEPVIEPDISADQSEPLLSDPEPPADRDISLHEPVPELGALVAVQDESADIKATAVQPASQQFTQSHGEFVDTRCGNTTPHD